MISARRPRAEQVIEAPIPAAPAIDQPIEVMSQPELRPATTRTAKPKRRDHWLDRLIGESFLLGLALAGWGINALFTVLALVALGVLWPIGALIHLGISKAEVHLWHRAKDPAYLVPLVGCLLIDIGTTVWGALTFLSVRFPALLGSTPADLSAWRALLRWPMPLWTPNALAVILCSIVLAIGSELFVKKYWSGVRQTWRERHA